MIRHIVLFNLKSEITPADQEWLFSQMHKVLGGLPTVRRLALGKAHLRLDENGKPRRPSEFDWALSMEFDDAASLEQYSNHPDHRSLGAEIVKRAAVLKVLDFEG